VNLLQRLHEKKKINEENKKIKSIVEEYILENSPKDLCISKQNREELLNHLENRTQNYPAFKYFENICNDIRIEHQMDSFKRFGSSMMARDVLSTFQHDPVVMSPILGLLSVYKDFDFAKSLLSNEEIDFLNSISSHSSTWDTCYSNENVKISISKVNWFPEVSFIDNGVVSFQYSFSIPFPLQQVANGYFSFQKMNKIDPNIQKSKILEFNQYNDVMSTLIETEIVWTWEKPLVKRNSCHFISQFNKLMFVSKPYVQKDEEVKYFQYEIITLTEFEKKTSFNHIISIYSKETFNLEESAIQRGNTFYLSLMDSVGSSPMFIHDLEEVYSAENGKFPKDPFGKMLLSLKFDQPSIITQSMIDLDTDDSFSDSSTNVSRRQSGNEYDVSPATSRKGSVKLDSKPMIVFEE
jgi:hypothetical protein